MGNTALALAGLGVAVELVWDVGDDAMGTWLASEVAGAPPRRLAAPTSVTVALSHPDGERTFVSHLGHLAESTPDALERALAHVAAGELRVDVTRVFPFAEAAEAHRLLESRASTGKLLLEP